MLIFPTDCTKCETGKVYWKYCNNPDCEDGNHENNK